MKKCYLPKTFSSPHLDVIDKANAVLADYAAQGFRSMTLRQVYYQFVQRGWLPNTTQNYKRLGSILNDARLAGRVDWDRMEDRTRSVTVRGLGYDDVAEYVSGIGSDFVRSSWDSQPTWVEIWVEKEALIGVIDSIAQTWRLSTFACRGNVSQSAMFEAGQRLDRKLDEGKRVVILHLGDHDPNGIDMSRDNEDRLRQMIAGNRGYDEEDAADEFAPVWEELDDEIQPADGHAFEFRRVALNMDQVRQFNPPPNPVKLTDSRSSGYVARFGRESWELDALDPTALRALITAEVEGDDLIDLGELARVADETRLGRERLVQVAERWHEIEAFLADEDS